MKLKVLIHIKSIKSFFPKLFKAQIKLCQPFGSLFYAFKWKKSLHFIKILYSLFIEKKLHNVKGENYGLFSVNTEDLS